MTNRSGMTPLMPRIIRLFTLAAMAMLVLALPSSSLARKAHHTA